MKMGKKCKIYIFILIFLVLLNVFRPLYDIYGILSIIFGFSDPENPPFDILYVNVQKYLKKYKIWQFFFNIFAIFTKR